MISVGQRIFAFYFGTFVFIPLNLWGLWLSFNLVKTALTGRIE